MNRYRYEEDEEDELEVRVRRGVGRIPPQPPVIQPEHRYRSVRPLYEHGSSSYLIPAATSGIRRSLSTGHHTPPPPAPQPVIINNIQRDRDRSRDRSRDRRSSDSLIYDEYSDEEFYSLAPQGQRRSHSRSRPHSFSRPQSYAGPPLPVALPPQRDPRDEYELQRARQELEDYHRLHTQEEYELEKQRRELEKIHIRSSKENYELERTKRELAVYKAAEEREEEEKRIKEEIELARLKAEKKAAEEKARIEKENKAAIEKYKTEEAEKAAKQKKEKEERDKEYQKKFEDDLRKGGLDERQISAMVKGESGKGVDPNRPTYTRMSRHYLSIETLNRYRIDYEFDQDPDYVLIKRWVPEYEQDFLWAHTRQIREARRSSMFEIEQRRPMLVIEDKPKKSHHRETEFELVRTTKKKHERKPSPSPLLTFLAGGKPR